MPGAALVFSISAAPSAEFCHPGSNLGLLEQRMSRGHVGASVVAMAPIDFTMGERR